MKSITKFLETMSSPFVKGECVKYRNFLNNRDLCKQEKRKRGRIARIEELENREMQTYEPSLIK